MLRFCLNRRDPKRKVLVHDRPHTRVHDLDEVAERYRRSVPTVRYWRHTGYGPKGVKSGNAVLYPRASIEAFDRQLEAEAVAEAEGRIYAAAAGGR